jgi:hypothetical protein
MKIVSDMGGAIGAALIENPFVAAAIVGGVCVYGAYKAAETAVEALPGLYNTVVDALDSAYTEATSQVQAWLQPSPVIALEGGGTLTLPANARIIPIREAAAGQVQDVIDRFMRSNGLKADGVVVEFPRTDQPAPNPATEISIQHSAPAPDPLGELEHAIL